MDHNCGTVRCTWFINNWRVDWESEWGKGVGGEGVRVGEGGGRGRGLEGKGDLQSFFFRKAILDLKGCS